MAWGRAFNLPLIGSLKGHREIQTLSPPALHWPPPPQPPVFAMLLCALTKGNNDDVNVQLPSLRLRPSPENAGIRREMHAAGLLWEKGRTGKATRESHPSAQLGPICVQMPLAQSD
jgi:hypothetical protein